MKLTEEKWLAILHNDSNYDNQFLYAVKTTRIFCKPSCKSKPPNIENVCIFQDASQALEARFRPCKRCKPTGQLLPDSDWVEQITRFIDAHYFERLTLEKLAEMCHGSMYHLHRTFKRITGITPVAYIQQTRMNKAMAILTHTDISVAEIARSVGIANTPYFITLFRKITGLTPTAYRQIHREQPVVSTSNQI